MAFLMSMQLFAVDKASNIPKDIYAAGPHKDPRLRKFGKVDIDRSLGLPWGPRAKLKQSYLCKWIVPQPKLLARAMVSTHDYLFVAGPQDVMDEKDYFYRNVRDEYDPIGADVKKQAEAWTGKHGGMLMVISKEDGSQVASKQIDSIPAFDGMIAAEGNLFISLSNGKLTCLK